MKKIKAFISLIAILSVSSLFFSSCEKDGMVPPTIDFTTGAGYTSADAHIALNTAFKIGVVAKRTEDKDDLKTFTVTRSYDGSTATNFDNVTLTSARQQRLQKTIILPHALQLALKNIRSRLQIEMD